MNAVLTCAHTYRTRHGRQARLPDRTGTDPMGDNYMDAVGGHYPQYQWQHDNEQNGHFNFQQNVSRLYGVEIPFGDLARGPHQHATTPERNLFTQPTAQTAGAMPSGWQNGNGSYQMHPHQWQQYHFQR